MPLRTAILGWGSLLWDEKPEFDGHHGPWQSDGPELKVEFSRVSKTRSGALTLVIDPANGALCRVAYAISKRRDPEDAICDLRSREGTTRANVGFYFEKGARQSKDRDTLAAVQAWAAGKAVDAVVWTDLSSNYQQICGQQFTVERALSYLRTLDAAAKAGAAEYVWRAPGFVTTPLRTALQGQPWFQQ